MKHIVHISNDYLPIAGGISTHLQNLLPELSKAGNNISLIVPDENVPDDTIEEVRGYGVLRVRYRTSGNPLLKLYRITKCVMKGLRLIVKMKGEIDMIHQHDHRATRLGSSLFAGKRKIPLVWTNHFIQFFKWYRIPERTIPAIAGKRPDGIISVHKTTAEKTGRSFFKNITTEYIPNGVDLDVFTPEGAGDRSQDSTVSILFPQRLHPIKGPDVFADAILMLYRKFPDNNLKFLVTDGKETSNVHRKTVIAFREKLKPLTEKKKVLFFEAPAYSDMPSIYRKADVVVLPLQEETENMAVLETWASGKPLISTEKIKGNGYADHGTNCWLVESRNSDQLAEAILQLSTDKKLREKLGRNGRKLVEEYFSWKKTATQTLDFYNEILKNTE
jgi:glycosyltransferase involved in cell wall biosynthesis